MKRENLFLLGAIAVGGYFVWKSYGKGTAERSAMPVKVPSEIPPAASDIVPLPPVRSMPSEIPPLKIEDLVYCKGADCPGYIATSNGSTPHNCPDCVPELIIPPIRDYAAPPIIIKDYPAPINDYGTMQTGAAMDNGGGLWAGGSYYGGQTQTGDGVILNW